jgi:hypothetical protein
MPPRIVDANAAGGGVQNWYQSLPPITRFLATACFLSSLGCYVGLLKPFQLALLRDYVFKQYEVRAGEGALTRTPAAAQNGTPQCSRRLTLAADAEGGSANTLCNSISCSQVYS